MRVTNRQAKGTSKHNFREFDLKKANHINNDLTQNNQYLWQSKNTTTNKLAGIHFSVQHELSEIRDNLRNQDNKNKFDKLTKSQQLELVVYNRLFKNTIKNQNDRHISTRHYDKQRDIIDYYTNSKTEPTECILQIGNKDNHVSSSQLWDIYNDYVKEHNKRFGSQIMIINSSLHVEETTPHIHERKVFISHNNHNELCSNKSSCLKDLGFNLPSPNKKEGRYNNRLMEYSKVCRDLWIECCQKHNLDIEIIPGDPSKHGQELAKFKADREEQRLYNAIDEHNKQNAEWDKNNSAKLKQSIELNKGLDDLKEHYENNGYIEKLMLDLMYQDNPDYVEDYQQRAYDIMDNQFTPYETDTQDTDDLEI